MGFMSIEIWQKVHLQIHMRKQHTGKENNIFMKYLLQGQAKVLVTPSRQMKWHPLVIKYCFSIYHSQSSKDKLSKSVFLNFLLVAFYSITDSLINKTLVGTLKYSNFFSDSLKVPPLAVPCSQSTYWFIVLTCFRPEYALNICHWTLNNNQSITIYYSILNEN